MICRLLAVAMMLGALTACSGDVGREQSDVVEVPGIGSTRVDVPRPTGAASAACDSDPLPPTADESIEERVAALRAIGLFADRQEPDPAVAAEVDAMITEAWGDAIEPDDPLMDLFVAEQDYARVWWRDLEADVTEGNEVYVTTLQELAAVSVGSLDVVDATETWIAPDGPVTVRFRARGVAWELEPAMLEDWIDPGILVDLNRAIAESGRRFELYKAFDQTAVVMALTDDERRGLEARGWCFE